jgi:hypothetical protein
MEAENEQTELSVLRLTSRADRAASYFKSASITAPFAWQSL